MPPRFALTTIALLVLCGQVHAQTTILFEDFEDSTVSYVYNDTVGQATADDFNDIAAEDYFGRFDSDDFTLPADIQYTGTAGTGFFTAHDTDSATSGNIDDIVLDWTGINIANFTDLELSWFVAEDDDGTNEDWDITTSVRLEVQVDGGGFNQIFGIEGASATAGNMEPRVDTLASGFDGVGDGAAITDLFTQFTSGTPGVTGGIGTGNTLDIRLTIEDLDTGDEDIAFDNLLLTGITVVPEPSGVAFLIVFGSTIGLRRRRKD